ncbi:MAG: TIGR02452 family protein [Clostridiales bacterium]|nr:TIGR02452 family protein [Clostridiales bacterium]
MSGNITKTVYLPDDIEKLRLKSNKENISAENNKKQAQNIHRLFSCENTDALVLAQKKYEDLKNKGEADPKILVLNLASATMPGGHTRKGASAQEEDLCRRTSLLLSLESENAKKYYIYNNARKTRMGSDGVMITPYVEVIKDSSSETLAEPFPISVVISCAAPMVRLGLEGMSQPEYEKMLSKRIEGILLTAASQNYRWLILGAFGCGVYGNDAALVSDLFYRTILNFAYEGKSADLIFNSIDFAVLCRPDKDYNCREFYRNFNIIKNILCFLRTQCNAVKFQ